MEPLSRIAGARVLFLLACLGPIPLRAQTGESPTQAQGQTQGQTQEPAQDEITAVPNRPTIASTAETVQRGVLEIEYGFEGGRGHQNINGLVKFGLFKNLELWLLNNPFQRDAGVAATGDTGAGFKWRMTSQKNARPTISLLYTVTLPTAGNHLGAGAVGHQVFLLVSKDLGKHHFDVNEGVNYLGRPGASGFDRNYFSALSWAYPISKKWGVTAEIAGFSRASPAAPATMTLLFAPTYNLRSWMVLDAGAYYAVYGNLPRVTYFAGITYSIADLYGRHRTHKSRRK